MNAWMIIDGQWGSTGKGAIAGYVARKNGPDGIVCNFGPNAGHTFVFNGGAKVMTRQLPTGIVSSSVRSIFIGPGAIIDGDVLQAEFKQFEGLIEGKRIYIHERAAVVNDDHRAKEKDALIHISSTRKGTGAAMADKTMRLENAIARHYKGSGKWLWLDFVVDHDRYVKELCEVNNLQIESAQGYELGISSGSHYPFCTGRDITPYQVMSDCGIPYGMINPFVIASLRTFPIRVGDDFSSTGEKVGTSGPVYDDQQEITFADLGVPNEKTTVTGKMRRIFTFSNFGTERMLRSMRPHAIFLNFVNYVTKTPSYADVTVLQYVSRITDAYFRATGHFPNMDFVHWIGTGPEEKDIIDYYDPKRGHTSNV